MVSYTGWEQKKIKIVVMAAQSTLYFIDTYKKKRCIGHPSLFAILIYFTPSIAPAELFRGKVTVLHITSWDESNSTHMMDSRKQKLPSQQNMEETGCC